MTEARDKLLARLREPFPPEHIGKLPKPTKKDAPKGKCLPKRENGAAPDWQDHYCGEYHGLPAVHLDFVGHAAVTDRLLEVDPEWNWEPKVGWDDNGEPVFVRSSNGQPVRLWIDLTVLGITRPGVGTVDPGTRDPEKQLIGDAIRNAAMRFGVALDLWIKGQDEKHVEARTEPEDPDQWFRENGWADGGIAHDAYRDESKAIRNALSPEQRERYREWAKANELPFEPARTRAEAEKMRAKLVELRDEKPEQVIAPEDGQLVDVEHPPHVEVSEMDLTPVPYPDDEGRPF